MNDKDALGSLIDVMGGLLFGLLAMYALWYLFVGLLYAAAFIGAVLYALFTTFIQPPVIWLLKQAGILLLITFNKINDCLNCKRTTKAPVSE